MDTHGTPNTTPAPLDGFYASPAHMRMQARRVLALIEALGSGPRDRGVCLGVAANYARFAAEYLEA